LQSYFWAEPVSTSVIIGCKIIKTTTKLLLEVADKILDTLGAELNQWNRWTRVLSSPSELQRQMDGWSCGIFVMLAMQLCSRGESPTHATNDLIPDMRNDVLTLLLQETE
jgi:hypothetical protein